MNSLKRIPFSDRVKFIKEAIKAHKLLVVGFLIFFLIGCILIYVGTTITESSTKWFLYVFGGSFIGFMLFFVGFTMPSSLRYYYEKALIKKYGAFGNGIITKLEIEDHSYIDDEKSIEQFHYGIGYSFEYLNNTYEGFFYVYHKECFEKLAIGDTIPIKFLKTKPEKSFPRRIKLCNELQLTREFCAEIVTVD
ncbi:hypothetical protein ABN763_16755 [Spongiivirga sp. MCCC 1A20706]|uniref:hypothetical protein n=1 Tax=Spongiivirga sp. MCCC 1A20706 TaxID=3160963 RepID=UPI003977255C